MVVVSNSLIQVKLFIAYVDGLPFFYKRAFVSALLVFYKEGDKMYLTFNELLLFTSVLISLISLFVMIYNHKK